MAKLQHYQHEPIQATRPRGDKIYDANITPYTRLSAAILVRTWRDIWELDEDVSPERRLEALYWLQSPACQLILSSTAFDNKTGYELLNWHEKRHKRQYVNKETKKIDCLLEHLKNKPPEAINGILQTLAEIAKIEIEKEEEENRMKDKLKELGKLAMGADLRLAKRMCENVTEWTVYSARAETVDRQQQAYEMLAKLRAKNGAQSLPAVRSWLARTAGTWPDEATIWLSWEA